MEAAASSPAAVPSARRPDPLTALTVLAVLSLALFPVEINRAFGLPAHPLLIHLPVIAVPLLGLCLIVAAAKLDLLDRHGPALALLTVVSLASTLLAAGAGEAFRDSGEGGPGIAEHAEAGETLRLIMIGVAVIVFAALWARRRGVSVAVAGPATRVLFVAAAVAVTFFTIRTGHLGAKQTWGDKGGGEKPPAGMPAPRGGGDPDGDGS